MMYVLIEDINGKYHIAKKSHIRRVEEVHGVVKVLFIGSRNTPIKIKATVEEFYEILTARKRKNAS